MKKLETKHYEETTALLEAGVDYTMSELKAQWGNPNLRSLPPDKLMKIAKNHGYDECSWAGYEGTKAPETLEVHFRRELTAETKKPEEQETVYTSEILEQATEDILLAPSATAALKDVLIGLDGKTVEDDLADFED